jgi:F0F1-type ATP synthase assembly protein I
MRKGSPQWKGNIYVRFSSIGIQMGLIIFLCTWFGVYLDERYSNTTPWFTLALSLIGVIGSMALIIRAVIKLNKRNDSSNT